MVCPHGQGSQFFAILCGRVLWTVPNLNYILLQTEKHTVKGVLNPNFQPFSFELIKK